MGKASFLHGNNSSCHTARLRWVVAAAAGCLLLLLLRLTTLTFRNQPLVNRLSSGNGFQALYDGPYGAEAKANLSDFRSSLLSHVWQSFDPAAPQAHGFQRFDALKPVIRCPPEMPLQRYGGSEDGGKSLCDVSKLRSPCLIYSLGSGGHYNFEQDMLKATECEIHTFDCTVDGVSQDPTRHFYHKWCVGAAKDPNFKTWGEITKELGHQHRTLDIFKMDIEGHEPGVLAELRHNSLQPRQMVMEIHMHTPQQDTPNIARTAPRTSSDLALLFMHIASLGYGIVAQEDNIGGLAKCCAEWTFLLVEQPWVAASTQLAAHSPLALPRPP